MSRIVKVSNGDYRLQVQTGGNIIMDTQSTTGKVLVIGDLDVQGALTYVESTNTQVTDNILQLNYGQTGNGISAGNNYTSGIEVERGNYSAAQFVFNEQLTHYDATSSSNVSGTWSARTANGTLNAIQLRTIVTDGVSNLSFDLLNSNITLRVANSSNYYLNVLDDNDLVTKKWVSTYIASNYVPGSPTQGVALVDRVIYPATNGTTISNASSSIEANNTNIVFQIAQTTISTLDTNGLTTGYVRIGGGSGAQLNTITNTSSNNLIITATNGTVEVNAVLNLDNQSATPSYSVGTSKIYSSATNGPGKSGIFFTNSNNQTPDELISRNRAVLLSILL